MAEEAPTEISTVPLFLEDRNSRYGNISTFKGYLFNLIRRDSTDRKKRVILSLLTDGTNAQKADFLSALVEEKRFPEFPELRRQVFELLMATGTNNQKAASLKILIKRNLLHECVEILHQNIPNTVEILREAAKENQLSGIDLRVCIYSTIFEQRLPGAIALLGERNVCNTLSGLYLNYYLAAALELEIPGTAELLGQKAVQDTLSGTDWKALLQIALASSEPDIKQPADAIVLQTFYSSAPTNTVPDNRPRHAAHPFGNFEGLPNSLSRAARTFRNMENKDRSALTPL